jgi:beta-ureidopropionase
LADRRSTPIEGLARRYKMVLLAPIYEVEMTGVFYNIAAVCDADGRYLGNAGSTIFLAVIRLVRETHFTRGIELLGV